MFAAYSGSWDQGFMMFLFLGATLIMFAKRFAAGNPEAANTAGKLALKGGMGLAKRLMK